MKDICLAHSVLSHDWLYKLYVLRTVPTVFPVQLPNYFYKVWREVQYSGELTVWTWLSYTVFKFMSFRAFNHVMGN